jgi:glycosyltransferase involved in cell wall biosynthesis
MRQSADYGTRRVLFVQATDPALYPPLLHASLLLAENGAEVTFLAAPFAGRALKVPSHPRVEVATIRERPSHVMGKRDYARYLGCTAKLAWQIKPHVVYASDPLGAMPGLLAARIAGADLVYHEHDTPGTGALRPWLRKARAAAAREARAVVFPNAQRAQIAQAELGFAARQLKVVWNLPRLAELPAAVRVDEPPLWLYYHGSITPERLPETFVHAVRRFGGHVRLRIAGYEAPGAPGYIRRLLSLGRSAGTVSLVEYAGLVPRESVLDAAARNHVGLAIMPRVSNDVNMRHMTGASNKAFDYMAARLALIVSDLRDWNEVFVDPGFALACNAESADSIEAVIRWLIEHPDERLVMANRARRKIETEWNYDAVFAPLLRELSHG